MRTVFAVLLLLSAALQVKHWFSDVGYFAAQELTAARDSARSRNALLEERNRLLMLEVLALKEGNAALESRARSDLGMVKDDEVFFIVPDPD